MNRQGADVPRQKITARIVARAKAILEAKGLADISQLLLPHVLPSIELEPGKRARRPLGVGSSKIGGSPDLPTSTKWPRDREKRPLSFLLQVALHDLPMLDVLPENGMLSFFYDTMNMPDVAEGNAAKSCRVLYLAAEEDEPLSTREAPTDEDGPTTDLFEEFPLKAKLVPSFPDDLTLLADPVARREYLGDFVNPERSVFKLLGHPNTIQLPMQIRCAMVARELDPDADAPSPRMATRIKREAEQWILLLQIDSSNEMQMNWGDCGRLYFWIRRNDLERRKFARVMLCFQSH